METEQQDKVKTKEKTEKVLIGAFILFAFLHISFGIKENSIGFLSALFELTSYFILVLMFAYLCKENKT